MDPITVAVFGILFMFLLIILQVPIGISMAVAGIVGFGILSGFKPAFTIIATESSSIISNADLAVIPLFLLMGNFATSAGLSGDIYNLAYAFLGHRRGGLALSTIAGCGFFGAVCGSSTATAATFGRVALPEMLKRKYAPHFAAGCIAAGGTLGSLVPPSVILIIYAVMAEEFIITLFIAAIIPSIISIASYFIAISIYLRIKPTAGPPGLRVNWPDRFRTALRCWGVIMILVVVVGGIYGGIFTVTEAAAFGTVLCFLFALGRRKMTRAIFWEALTGTALSASMIYVIIIGANVMTYFVTVTHMPDHAIELISGLQLPHFAVLTILLVVYLILGSVFDTVAAMVITLPFVLPLITSMGYSPIWWGIVNVVITEIGMITPPIGLNVFILHGVAPDLPLSTIFRGIVPFLIADIGRLILLVVFPVLILWLPSILQ
ncbi:MAG: TRAP transporter large permease [Pseudomonadota bacterium]